MVSENPRSRSRSWRSARRSSTSEIEETEQDWEKTQRKFPRSTDDEKRSTRRTPSAGSSGKRFAIQSAFWIENPSQSLLK